MQGNASYSVTQPDGGKTALCVIDAAEVLACFCSKPCHFTRSSGPLARLTSSQRCAAQDCQEFRMGDNSFLSPAFIILVIGVIAVVLFLVTRAKKKRNKK
ncbi:hypothetical protein G3566_15710 [Xanthomonas citri]|uniref:hypothetical protein n=1 Tax=Xanthomonas citri TaxID=346 RepID=UPI001884F296|nr:hypothetical protein [Xanthomonas citri]QQK66101.1 hypothetical protein G3566_15710 [Xanthomonas citri]